MYSNNNLVEAYALLNNLANRLLSDNSEANSAYVQDIAEIQIELNKALDIDADQPIVLRLHPDDIDRALFNHDEDIDDDVFPDYPHIEISDKQRKIMADLIGTQGFTSLAEAIQAA